MHISTSLKLTTALLIGSACTATSSAALPDISNFAAKSKSISAFSNDRFGKIEAMNAKMFKGNSRFRAGATQGELEHIPAILGPTSNWGDIDGPDGKVWFYSLDINYDTIEHEYYTEYISRHWTLNLFDENMMLVTTLQDDVRYEDGEKRTVLLEPLPLITKNYFNDDDKYEVAMSFGINWQPGHNHYRTIIYQIGGEKDENGNSKELYHLDELIGDVAVANPADGSEEIYMTLMYENAYIPEEFDWNAVEETPDFWTSFCAQHVTFNLFKKTGDMKTPVKVLSKSIPYANFPGAQEGSPIMTVSHGEKAYAVFSYYKEPLFNPFYSWTDDYSQREENTLVVEIYELSDNPRLVQTTEIPFAKANEDLLAKYFSIGDFRYTGDVNFSDYGTTDGQAALIVTEARQNRGEESPSAYTYYIYNPDGTLRNTIFDGAENHTAMADLDGFEPQELFVTTKWGEYYFNFVDLISCKQVASFSYLLEIDEDADPDAMTFNIDRVKSGKSYMYVDEMRMPIDVDDYSWLRFAWLDKKGEFDHFDYVNMGKNVHYAMSYLTEKVLHPDVFHSDAEQEYMMLIKRAEVDANGEESNNRIEELLVAQAISENYPDGRDLLLVGPGENGVLSGVVPFIYGSNPKLGVSWYNREDDKYYTELYTLPLDQQLSAIDAVGASSNIPSAAHTTGVYNLHGIRVASATAKESLNALPAGIYIVKSEEGTFKISK